MQQTPTRDTPENDSRALLIVAHPFLPPAKNVATARLLALGKYLPGENFEVIYSAGDAPAATTDTGAAPKDRLLLLKKLYRKLPVSPPGVESLLKTLHYFLQARRARAWADRTIAQLAPQIESAVRAGRKVILFTSFSPVESHLIGLHFKRQYGQNLLWLADMRDEMSGNKYYTRIARLHLLFYEKRILARADHVLVVSVGQRDHYQALYRGLPRSISIYMNGFDFPVVGELAPTSPQAIRLIYSGAIYGKINVDTFFAALALLAPQEQSRFHLTLVGNIPESLLYKHRRFRDLFTLDANWHTYGEIIAKIAASDVGLVVDPPDMQPGRFPVKLADYLGARVSILALVGDGLSREVIERGNCGYVVPYGDATAMAQALRRIIADYDRGTLRRSAPDYAEKFSRKNQVQSLEREVTRLLRS